MHDEVEEKVGYRCPPRSGRIKKGERRNPNGRRGNKPARVTESDADILARLDAELIDFNGERITRREAGLRVLHAKAMKGDSRAILERERIRNADRQEKTVKRGGVLLLPSPVPLDEWEAASARQQAQYRERDDERIE